MTLFETIRAIEAAASRQPSVNMIVRNDIFRLNAAPAARYGVFAWTQQQHVLTDDLMTFAFSLFYVDRLTEDKRNELEIQSVGVATLSDVIRRLEDAGVYPTGETTFNTFNQRFVDECAGVWANVRFQVSAGWICPDDAAVIERPYLEIAPKILWLADWGINDVFSNTTWEVD